MSTPTTITTIPITKDYGYVLLVASASHIFLNWLGYRSTRFRKEAGVPYPLVLATPETIASTSSPAQRRAMYLFNCAQRAHHNILENYSAFLSGLLISGLTYPKISAVMGSAWLVGRWVYATGYTSADEGNVNGRGRWRYGGFQVAATVQVGFICVLGKMGWDSLRS
jgi:glutathione S-transferase